MNEGSLCVRIYSLVAGEMAWSVCVVRGEGDSHASVMQLQSRSSATSLVLGTGCASLCVL